MRTLSLRQREKKREADPVCCVVLCNLVRYAAGLRLLQHDGEGLRAVAELWGDERLWVSFDGVGLRLPDRPGYDGGDGFMHVSAAHVASSCLRPKSQRRAWLAVGPAGRAPASRARPGQRRLHAAPGRADAGGPP